MSTATSVPKDPERIRAAEFAVSADGGRLAGGAEVVELASHPAADVQFDWDDTADEPLLWAHALEATEEAGGDRVGSFAPVPASHPQKPAEGRRAAGSGRTAPSRFRLRALAVALALAGLAVGAAAVWLAREVPANPKQVSAAPAVGPFQVQPHERVARS